MDKILGKIATFFLLLITLNVQAYITLEVVSFDGRKIAEVVAGEPFILKVSTDEVEQVHDMQVQGLQGLSAQKTGLSLITINGKKTAHVNFQVQADKPGSYTFGPAFMPNGQTRSDTVVLKVNAERITDKAVKKQQDAQGSVMLRLAVDNDAVYVGQKIKTMLRAYFPEGEDISIDQVVVNDPTTIDVTEKVGPKKGTETISGSNYIYLEWEWDMYPKEPGSLIIPAYFIDYSKALPTPQGFGSLAMIFGPRYERKRAYSNALSLQVRPLPDTQQTINAVGNFISYRAQIKPPVAKKYEGMVLTLTLEGEGNMGAIREPELIGIPDAFKYYFSKSNVVAGSFGQQKTFEYIVQGMQEGEWEIPAQTFTFFDPEGRGYKTLETGALLLTVLPGQAATPIPSTLEVPVEPTEVKTGAFKPMLALSKDVLPTDEAIPFGWFVFLFCLPLIMFGSIALLKSDRCIQIVAPHYIKRRAFVFAQKELARAYKHHDVRAIHSILTQLVARRIGSDTPVETVVAKSSWSASQKQAWQIFYEKVSQAAYAADSGTKDVVRLFHEAAQWLKDFEGII